MLLLSLFLACADVQPGEGEPIVEIQEVEKCATLVDHQICDFDAIDEYGEPAFLSDLYGSPIVLDLSAMWCGPCQAAGRAMQETADAYPEITFLTVLIEDGVGDAPEVNDIEGWKSSMGITSCPVWGASREIVSGNVIDIEENLYLTAWPTFYFIDSEGKLQHYMKGYSEEALVELSLGLE